MTPTILSLLTAVASYLAGELLHALLDFVRRQRTPRPQTRPEK